jgi:TMEM175 potassium channel family protein
VGKGRLEAFSDGVIAIIITIMVLELKVPHDATLASLAPVLPILCSYTVSFVFVAIYWNNHHHMLHAAKHVNGKVLWANMHLLFWLSLLPFATGWIGEHPYDATPTALYGAVCLASGVAWLILQSTLVGLHGHDSTFAQALGSDLKGKISAIAYIAGIGLAYVEHWISVALYVMVALMWLVPDRRFERAVHAS